MRLLMGAAFTVAIMIGCAIMVFFLALPIHRVPARDLDGRYAN